MNIIRFDGRIYFILNPYDVTGNAPDNIVAYTIGSNGYGHELIITCEDYKLQNITTYVDEAYSTGYDALISDAEKQMREAVSATKQGLIYCTGEEKRLFYEVENDLWDIQNSGDEPRNNYVAVDMNNDGKEEVIVVQFWTHEYNGIIYCMTLQRNQLLYTLQVFSVQNGESRLVCKSLFFDESQEALVSFDSI
jgi:hypothetical protein